MTSINYFNRIELDLSIARNDEEFAVNSSIFWSDKSSKGDPGIFYLRFAQNDPGSDTIEVNNDLNIVSNLGSINKIYITNTAQSGKFINLYYSNFIRKYSLPTSTTSSGSASSSTTIRVLTPTVDIPSQSAPSFIEIFPANPSRIWICVVTGWSGVWYRHDESTDIGYNFNRNMFDQEDNFPLNIKDFNRTIFSTSAVYGKVMYHSDSSFTVSKSAYWAIEEIKQ